MAANTSKETPLHQASAAGDVDAVRKLVRSGADVNARNSEDDTPLNVAALSGKKEVIRVLVKEFGCSPHTKGFKCRTPLHEACNGGHVDVARKLVTEYGADVNARDNEDNTPLILAARFSGKMELINMLVKEYGCSPHTKGQVGRTLLHLTCEGGHVDVARKLVTEYGADVNARDNGDNTPLNLAARFSGKMELINVLVKECGCSPHTKGRVGRTLLHNACDGGNVDVARKLVTEYGADVNARDNEDNTPLNLAARFSGKMELIDMLVKEYGCSPHTKGQVGRTLLHLACEGGHVDVARKLVTEYGAHVNARDNNDNTPLTLAVYFGKIEVVRMLITDFHVNLETKGQRGGTALHRACVSGKEDVARMLVSEFGADVNARDSKNKTPLDIATSKGFSAIIGILSQARPPVVESNQRPSWVVDRQEVELTGEELGRGGWAVVKVAHFRGQRVAAKCLHGHIISPYNRRKFQREMQIADRVRHPNLLLFLGATLKGEPLILTELMPTSLRAVLGQRALSRGQVVSIGRDVASALNYLHLMKPDPVLHRDISSANVLLEPSGTDNSWKAKVSDYGSANYQLQLGTVGPGCPAYAAPEANNPARQSPKMDVFSYGVLLLEMASREMPDEEERRRELLREMGWPAMEGLVRECTREEQEGRPTMAVVLKRVSSF